MLFARKKILAFLILMASAYWVQASNPLLPAIGGAIGLGIAIAHEMERSSSKEGEETSLEAKDADSSSIQANLLIGGRLLLGTINGAGAGLLARIGIDKLRNYFRKKNAGTKFGNLNRLTPVKPTTPDQQNEDPAINEQIKQEIADKQAVLATANDTLQKIQQKHKLSNTNLQNAVDQRKAAIDKLTQENNALQQELTKQAGTQTAEEQQLTLEEQKLAADKEKLAEEQKKLDDEEKRLNEELKKEYEKARVVGNNNTIKKIVEASPLVMNHHVALMMKEKKTDELKKLVSDTITKNGNFVDETDGKVSFAPGLLAQALHKKPALLSVVYQNLKDGTKKAAVKEAAQKAHLDAKVKDLIDLVIKAHPRADETEERLSLLATIGFATIDTHNNVKPLVVKAISEQIKSADDEVVCSVGCMNALNDPDYAQITVADCGHYFHKDCLDTWLRSNWHGNCPVCRTKVTNRFHTNNPNANP